MSHRVACVVVLAHTVLGCGGARHAASDTEDVTTNEQGSGTDRPTSGVAGHGEVCSAHDGSVTRPCAEGLSCCYPCGIQGCDSVCHTEEECRVDMMRP